MFAVAGLSAGREGTDVPRVHFTRFLLSFWLICVLFLLAAAV